MKRISIVLAVLLCAAVAAIVFAAPEEKETKKPSRRQNVFMKQKLVYSQLVLEGLTLEKYDLIITNGRKMWNMSQDNLWQQLFSEEYKKHSQTFRDNVMAMIEAAREKKLDAAMEAYTKSLRSCYECHKYFRVEQRAKLPPKKSFE
jgi:cytochrome c556